MGAEPRCADHSLRPAPFQALRTVARWPTVLSTLLGARVNEAGSPLPFMPENSGYFESQSVDWGEMANLPAHLISNFQTVTLQLSAYLRHAGGPGAARIVRTFSATSRGERRVRLRLGTVPAEEPRACEAAARLGGLKGDPVEYFRRHIWVEPFAEEDVAGLVDCIGADRVVVGSDFPHVEGTAEPAAFLEEIGTLSPGVLRRIMRENALELMADPR